MTPEETINGVMDAVEARVLTAANVAFARFHPNDAPLIAENVYESLDSMEGVGAAIFVSGEIPSTTGLGACDDAAELSINVGFVLPNDRTTPDRVQRMAYTLAIRKALTWGPTHGTPIPGASMPVVTDMAVSGFGKKRDGWLTGGLAVRYSLKLPVGL